MKHITAYINDEFSMTLEIISLCALGTQKIQVRIKICEKFYLDDVIFILNTTKST